jgi:hypothetical protein
MKPVRDDKPVRLGGPGAHPPVAPAPQMTLEERVARLEKLAGLGPADENCTLCNGTGKVRWGRPDRMGGEVGPCVCILPAWQRRP